MRILVQILAGLALVVGVLITALGLFTLAFAVTGVPIWPIVGILLPSGIFVSYLSWVVLTLKPQPTPPPATEPQPETEPLSETELT